MKKIINSIAVILFLTVAFSCTNDEQETQEGISREISVSISGIIDDYTPNVVTKATAQNVVRINWEGGEKVYAYEGSKYLGELTSSIEGTNGTYAKLTGTITAPTKGKTVTLVYSPQFAEHPAVDGNGKISLDLSKQDGTTVPFLVYGTTSSLGTSVKNLVVNFALATSVYKINCTGLPTTGNIEWAAIGDANTVCSLKMNADGQPEVSGSNPGVIKYSGSFSGSDERTIFSLAVVSTATTNHRTIMVSKNGTLCDASFDRFDFAASKAYNTVVVLKPYPAKTLGKFSVAAGKQVYFSKGNLYHNSNSGFHFEENQVSYKYEYSDSYKPYFNFAPTVEKAIWKDYPGKMHAEPYDYEIKGDILFTNNTATTPNPDFEVDGQKGIWRTLSADETNYLFSHSKCGFGKILTSRPEDQRGHSGDCGLVILPDFFVNPLDRPFKATFTEGWTDNVYTVEEWAKMEAAGVVMLSKNGERYCNDGDYEVRNYNAYYWASESNGSNEGHPEFERRMAMQVSIWYDAKDITRFYPKMGWRFDGQGIRLVMDCE